MGVQCSFLRAWSWCLLSLVTILLPWGCGYTPIARQGSLSPLEATTLAVPIFTNRTSEPGLELLLTEAVRREFQGDGRLRIVSMNQSEAVLKGAVVRYGLKPLSFDRQDNATEYRAELEIEVTLVGRGQEVVFFRKTLVSEQEFPVSAAVVSSEAHRVEALRQVSTKLAQQLKALVLDGREIRARKQGE